MVGRGLEALEALEELDAVVRCQSVIGELLVGELLAGRLVGWSPETEGKPRR